MCPPTASGTPGRPGSPPETAAWPRGRRLALLVALLALIAAGRLAIQVPRLVSGPPEVFGAVDLSYRFAEVRRWFAGEPVYGALDTAVYPPATHALLWPLIGWPDWPGARLLWAATALPALLLLAFQCAAASAPRSESCRSPGWWLGFLLPVSFYAAGVTLGAGQMLVHLLPLVIAAVLRLARRPSSLSGDLAAAGLLTLALAKPNATAPFLWLALLLPGRPAPETSGDPERPRDGRPSAQLLLRWRPLAFTGAAYLVLTLLALSFQPGDPGSLLADWQPTATGVAAASGYGHLGVWLAALGLGRWQLAASLLAALGLGIWLARHRTADPWVLLGVTGIFARVWSYHQYYDDLLVLPALVAALRLARRSPQPLAGRARLGFAAALAITLLPTPLHYALPPPWPLLFDIPQMLAWAILLAVLVAAARLPRPALSPAGAAGPGRTQPA